MVGSIKNFTGQRVEVSKGMTEGKVQSETSVDSSVAAISGSKVDAVLTSDSRKALKVMAENPSINMEAVERISGHKIHYKIVDRRGGDAAFLVANNKKAEAILGWRPLQSDLDTMIQHAHAWYNHCEI